MKLLRRGSEVAPAPARTWRTWRYGASTFAERFSSNSSEMNRSANPQPVRMADRAPCLCSCVGLDRLGSSYALLQWTRVTRAESCRTGWTMRTDECPWLRRLLEWSLSPPWHIHWRSHAYEQSIRKSRFGSTECDWQRGGSRANRCRTHLDGRKTTTLIQHERRAGAARDARERRPSA